METAIHKKYVKRAGLWALIITDEDPKVKGKMRQRITWFDEEPALEDLGEVSGTTPAGRLEKAGKR